MLSFITITNDLWNAPSGSGTCCVPTSLPTRYLLCSIRDVADLGVICLDLLSHSAAVAYAYVFLPKVLNWVLVMRGGGSFLGLAGPRVEDPLLRCRNPYLYVPLGLAGRDDVKGLVGRLFSMASRYLGEGGIASVTVRRLANHLVVTVNAETRISVRTLRKMQEELVKLGTYSVVKCASKPHKHRARRDLDPLMNALTKHV